MKYCVEAVPMELIYIDYYFHSVLFLMTPLTGCIIFLFALQHTLIHTHTHTTIKSERIRRFFFSYIS